MKRIALVGTLAAATVALVACGSDTPAPATNSTAPATVTVTEAPASSAPASTAKDSGNATAATPAISQQDAEQTALDDAGVTRDQVTNWDRTDFDSDKDDVPSWEIEFDVNTTTYEYDIDATTGAIITKEIDQ
ncbi:PepSY domain-containing protein [Corynebacterium uterequi]|uniref:Peptidase propeptide domain-containing protein n=1 Tax=Corynebacterium uterequi TaxID=1072256 RepID=A0A0G3HFM6_9CORY|nr:PepSY domain-containing protein [Corynebacterium uterequi]AKK10743.1 Peptidase propeptide domain-containing protein [Corynebacterium uterequi]